MAMRRVLLVALLALGTGRPLWAAGLQAVSGPTTGAVTLTWDPSPAADQVLGYKVLSGSASGTYSRIDDVGPLTLTTLSGFPAGTYFFVVEAYDATGALSGPSNEVSWTSAPVDPACVFPTGKDAVLITVTAFQKTGSGGAGSRARLDFQVASPSPIVRVEIISGSRTLAHMDGTDVGALAGIWFTVPSDSGAYPLALTATNAYGCGRVQPTAYSVTVP
jgi:hypothetical protein